MENRIVTDTVKITALDGQAFYRTPDGLLHELHVGDEVKAGTEVILSSAQTFTYETIDVTDTANRNNFV